MIKEARQYLTAAHRHATKAAECLLIWINKWHVESNRRTLVNILVGTKGI